jgi:drug/metabolite transporter (DMT)-like permease
MAAVLVPARALSGAAFATLLLIALMMGANHVAARFAFNHGVDVATAVVFRSGVTAAVIIVILASQGVRPRFSPRHRRMLPLIGLLVGVQSLCIYSSVARLPVALALLAFNTYPIWTAFWDAVVYRRRPDKTVLAAMPVILLGLALALDVSGAASGLGAFRPVGAHRRRRRFRAGGGGDLRDGPGAHAARGGRPRWAACARRPP